MEMDQKEEDEEMIVFEDNQNQFENRIKKQANLDEEKKEKENKKAFYKVLPPVISKYILSFLPLRQLCRMCTVSKELNGFFFSNIFFFFSHFFLEN